MTIWMLICLFLCHLVRFVDADCLSNPCQYNGTCVLASFRCECPLGFTGHLCDIQCPRIEPTDSYEGFTSGFLSGAGAMLFLFASVCGTVCLSRSRYRSIRMDIHNNLKETVANGYLSRSYNGGRNYALWKNYFRRNFCNLPIHEDCNATRDLAYLERKGHIKIGDYNVLIDIFRKIDERAIQYIEKKTSDIKAVGKDVRKKKWARLRIAVNPNIVSERQEKDFSDLLQAVADYMKSPHWASDFQTVTRMSNVMADKSGMNAHLVDLVNTLIQKTSHIHEMTDDVIHKFVVGILKFATSLHNDFGFVIQKIRSKCVDFYGEFAKDPEQKAEDKLRSYACAEMSNLLSSAGFSRNELNVSMELHYFPRDIYDKIIEHWDFYHHTMHLQKSKSKSFMSQDLLHKDSDRFRSTNQSRTSSRFK